jgi:hypothetical protein
MVIVDIKSKQRTIPNGSVTGTKEAKECRALKLVLTGSEAGVSFM